MVEVFFSVDNNKEIIRIPYVPHGTQIETTLNNGSFERSDGTILTLIGKKGLRTIAIDSFFPSKVYYWLLPNFLLADDLIDFFNRNREKIMRIVIVGLWSIDINMLCTISNFSYLRKQNSDVDYSLTILEYIDPNLKNIGD